jgi:hypothetical protein
MSGRQKKKKKLAAEPKTLEHFNLSSRPERSDSRESSPRSRASGRVSAKVGLMAGVLILPLPRRKQKE